jgi:tetratricopeptide (TPR) repeat protein
MEKIGIQTQTYAFRNCVSSTQCFLVRVTLLALLALLDLSSAAQEQSPSSFENLAKSAVAARDAGDTEQAIRGYQRAIDVRPDWSEGWWYLGILQYDADRFSAASAAFKRVVQLSPNLGPAWSLLGLCEFETREYESSREHLQKGEELGTGDDAEIARVSKYHLGLLLNRSGEFEKAFSTLSSAFGEEIPAQGKVALGLSLLRVPLLPQEVDSSKDALIQASGETASVMARGDTVKTINSFRQLLKDYSNIPYLHHALATVLDASGQNEAALLEEEQEMRISPQSMLPYLEINLLELRLGHRERALEAAKTALQIAPNDPRAHQALAKTLEVMGENNKAAAEYRISQALSPAKPVRETRALQMFASNGEEVPQTPRSADSALPSLKEIASEATALQGSGKTADAIRTYQQALQAHPEWNDGWWNLGMLAYSTGNYPEAITALKVCAQRNLGGGTAWAVMGLSEFAVKDYNNAQIHLQRGQDLGMNGSAESVQLARYQLGLLLNRAGQFGRASELLASVANSGLLTKGIQFALGLALLRIPLLPERVEPAKSKMVLAGGEIAALLHESKYDEALPKFKILLQDYPAVPFLHYAYGTALADLSQYDEAELQLRQEINISPASELPYLALAAIALKTRHAADALPLAQRAVQLRDDSPEAHYLLGRSYLDLDQNNRAMQALERAAKMAPDTPEVHFNLAKAYARLNLSAKSEEERAAFIRLNTLAEKQRSQSGSQSYSGSHENSDISHSSGAANQFAPDTH